jgi:dTDP-4-dehydrorhamnose 3,5-epimerase
LKIACIEEIAYRMKIHRRGDARESRRGDAQRLRTLPSRHRARGASVRTIATELEGVVVVEPQVHGDGTRLFSRDAARRGYRAAGIELNARGGGPVQLNHSRSARGTLRGLHFQEPRAQGKLVWAVAGAVFDVAVDVRRGSPTFGRWAGIELSADNHRQMWIPPGLRPRVFACCPETADCMYACSDYYAPECEHAIAWNDPQVAVPWPVKEPILSAKDARAPRLSDAPVLPSFRR